MFLKDWGPSKFLDLIKSNYSIFTVFDQIFQLQQFPGPDVLILYCFSLQLEVCLPVKNEDDS